MRGVEEDVTGGGETGNEACDERIVTDVLTDVGWRRVTPSGTWLCKWTRDLPCSKPQCVNANLYTRMPEVVILAAVEPVAKGREDIDKEQYAKYIED